MYACHHLVQLTLVTYASVSVSGHSDQREQKLEDNLFPEEDGKDEIMLTIDGKEIRDNVRICRSNIAPHAQTGPILQKLYKKLVQPLPAGASLFVSQFVRTEWERLSSLLIPTLGPVRYLSFGNNARLAPPHLQFRLRTLVVEGQEENRDASHETE